MSTWIVTRKSDGAEVYRYEADAPIEWAGFEFATHNHVAAPDAPAPGPTPSLEQRWITRLAFRNRFTAAEKAAIELASIDNPNAAMQDRLLAAGLRAAMKDQQTALYIDLNRDDVRAAVQGLEQAGLVAVGRAAEILDGQIMTDEVFNG